MIALIGIDLGKSGAIVGYLPATGVVYVRDADGPDGYRVGDDIDPGKMDRALQDVRAHLRTHGGTSEHVLLEVPIRTGKQGERATATKWGAFYVWKTIFTLRGIDHTARVAQARKSKPKEDEAGWRDVLGTRAPRGSDAKAPTLARVRQELPQLELTLDGKRKPHTGRIDAAGMVLALVEMGR